MSTLPSPIPEIDFKTNTAPFFPFVSMDHISKSPLNPAAFKKVLENHPDRHWVENVVLPLVSSNGLQLTYSKKGTGPGKAALAVRPTHRPALLKSIWKDLDHKRIAGPYTYDSLPAIAKSRAHFNPFFAIAKSEPGKFRPVINMSDGGKNSVNASVQQDYPMKPKYTSLKAAMDMVVRLGQGSWLYVIDYSEAFPSLRVNTEGALLQAFQIGELFFLCFYLAMGGTTAPWIFQQVDEVLMYGAHQRGVRNLQSYVDDHLGGETTRPLATQSANVVLSLAITLGFWISQEKFQLAQQVEYIGVVFDTVAWRMYFSESKLEKHKLLIKSWLAKTSCRNREIRRLLGKLHWFCVIYRGGGLYCARIEQKTYATKDDNHIWNLTFPDLDEFRKDLFWWDRILAISTGRSLPTPWPEDNPLVAIGDACKAGCGAYLNSGQWFYFDFATFLINNNLNLGNQNNSTVYELTAALLACATFAPYLSCNHTHTLLYMSDNMGTVNLIASRKTQEDVAHGIINDLLRLLGFLEAAYDFQLLCHHIPGKLNHADPLSRNDMKAFRLAVPQAHSTGLRPNFEHLPGLRDGSIQFPAWI